MNSVPSVSHVSPRQVITPHPLEAEKKNEGTRGTERPLQGAKGMHGVSPVEVCDAAPGIFTGQDTGITKPVRHTTLCHRETERNAAQGAAMAMSAASGSTQMQSRHELGNVAGLENPVLTESEKKCRAVGTRFTGIIATLEDLLQTNPEKEGQKTTTTLRKAVAELKDIVAGPVDESRREEMSKLMSTAMALKNKSQLQEAKTLLGIVTEYTQKHHDVTVSSRLLQLKKDIAVHEKETEKGSLFSRESGEPENHWNFNKNLHERLAGLSFLLGIDVTHGNRKTNEISPKRFYQDILQLLEDYKKFKKELNKSPSSTVAECKPEVQAFFDALETIFEDEESGVGIFRDRAIAKFEKSISQLKHEGAHMSKEFNLATDILKFARNLQLIKQGDHEMAMENITTDKFSDTFNYGTFTYKSNYLEDYIRCEVHRQSSLAAAVEFCMECAAEDAPFSTYLSSLWQEQNEIRRRDGTSAHVDTYGEEQCG